MRIYTDAACATEPLVQGTDAVLASPGITVNVANNTTTTFYATAANDDGESLCSSTAVTYTEVSPPPAAPVVVDTIPASGSSDNYPRFRGTAPAGTVVQLYTDSACATEPVGSDTAAVFASLGIGVQVGDGSSTSIWAKAYDGETASTCSTTFATYVHALPKPPAPTFTDSDPDSPANANVPFVKGSAIAGGIVRIYTNPTCAAPSASEGTSASFASPGIQTSVLNDAATTLYATVTNSAGTTSLCSTSSLTYVEDSTAPETAISSGPAGTVPAGASVRFEFSSSEPASRFECHLHEPGFQPCASPATFPALPAGSTARNAQLQVRAIDRAGNEDATPAARGTPSGRRPSRRRHRRSSTAARCAWSRSPAPPARTRSTARRARTSCSARPATTSCAGSPATTASTARRATTACAGAAASIASSVGRAPIASRARAVTTA